MNARNLPYVLCLVAGPSLGLANTIHGQEILPIGDSRCGSCRIVTSFAMTIGEADDRFELGPAGVVAVDARGRIYAVGSDHSQLGVYSPTGQLLTVIGRRGAGPGEFAMIGPVIVGPSDSLFIFDPGLRRVTVLTDRYEMARTFPITVSPENAELVAGGFVVNAMVDIGEHIGVPLHGVSASGQLVSSWKTNREERYEPGVSPPLSRVLAPGLRGEIWSAPRNRYRIERWAGTGILVESLERRVSWFEPWATWPRDLQPPRTTGITVDPRGNLWFSAAVGKDYRPGQRPVDPPTGRVKETPRAPPPDSAHRSMIEVIDVRTRSVLASLVLEGLYWLSPRGDLLVRVRGDPDGRFINELYRYQLVR